MTEGKQTSAEPNATNIKADTPRILEELSRNNTAKSRSRKSGMRRFLIVVVLLVPVILAISFLLYEQSRTLTVIAELQKENTALQEAVSSVEARAARAESAQDSLPDNLANTAMLEALQATLENRINALARNAASVQEQLSALPRERENAQWLWTEVDYLLRLANQKLQLEGDGDSALLILSAVDEILRDSGEMSVIGVRDILAGEILALRAMEYVDVSGLYARLNGLLPMIEQLSMRAAMVNNYNTQLAQARAESVASGESLWARTLDLLRSIFVWQKRDLAPEALLPPPEEAILKQNLRLILEQAQLALLMEEPEVYRESLQKGVSWTEQYFAIDAGVGKTLQEELENLAAATVRANRPDISRSLQLLRQINSARNQTNASDGQ